MPEEHRRPVLSVEEALERILATVCVLEPERVPLLEAAGRVLAEAVTADRDIPPLANSAMDGYAVRGADLALCSGRSPTKSSVRLRVVGDVAAGHVSRLRVEPGTAVRIMTGAPVPAGADTVVRFEDARPSTGSGQAPSTGSGQAPSTGSGQAPSTGSGQAPSTGSGQAPSTGSEQASTGSGWVEILKAPPTGANVRPAGEDVRAGQVVLQRGKVLRPQEVGMLAAVGRAEVAVVRRPRVAILATGDEIVPPDQAPGPGQIRDANSYIVAAQVQAFGGLPLLLGVARDREELVRRGMREALAQGADFIITSGGVSVGDFDLVKQVLAAEGEMHFWSLNMKPGRPLAFGRILPPSRWGGTGGGVPLLGLPGNPVAAMISTELFGRPALLKMQGFTDWSRPCQRMQARLSQPIVRKDGRRHYLRVRLRETETGYEATLTGDQGSGILNSLVQADGLAVIPEECDHLPAGAEVEVLLLWSGYESR
ncbi:MAG: molybdopterin molybdotransferase MoeA [Anaerolineae bacterium]|nr:molybdopterin molybdotransferase MoeA [Anaerolineae bacterium]